MSTLYSNAPRCPGCAQRALLDESGAQALVDASSGNLEKFHCPYSAGYWHVWFPRVETPTPAEP